MGIRSRSATTAARTTRRRTTTPTASWSGRRRSAARGRTRSAPTTSGSPATASLLPDLRSNKFEGQASFVNRGLLLLGLGLDAEITPKLKYVVNANYLRFDKTGALDLLLFQPGIRKSIGVDLGAGFLWRPR